VDHPVVTDRADLDGQVWAAAPDQSILLLGQPDFC
jgi:hypothetical protein